MEVYKVFPIIMSKNLPKKFFHRKNELNLRPKATLNLRFSKINHRTLENALKTKRRRKIKCLDTQKKPTIIAERAKRRKRRQTKASISINKLIFYLLIGY